MDKTYDKICLNLRSSVSGWSEADPLLQEHMKRLSVLRVAATTFRRITLCVKDTVKQRGRDEAKKEHQLCVDQSAETHGKLMTESQNSSTPLFDQLCVNQSAEAHGKLMTESQKSSTSLFYQL